ncbi:MAG: flagellar protein FliL [Candidatus Atribacteria bacterium]|nr:flagellar protein FliL [Candidatus Atribacteria bacterium]
MPEEEKEEVENAPQRGFSFQKVMMLATFILIGFMVFIYLNQSGMLSNLSAGSSEKEESSVFYQFEPHFLVNLADTQVLRYLKVVLGVEVSNQRVAQELANRQVEVRDALIMVMSAKQSEDLATTEGKEQLKEEIKDTLNRLVGEQGEVKEVYFVDFVMQ